MSDDSWYRGEEWDEASRVDFEERLSRTRSSKPQYLRIKAAALLGSNDPVIQRAGIDLMRRLIEGYPADRLNVPFAHEQLGDYFRVIGERDEAKKEYRSSIAKSLPNRSGTKWPDLSLVELLIDDGETQEGVELWQTCRSMSRGQELFPAVAFDFYRVEAKVLAATGDRVGATGAAKRALEAVAATRSSARNHPHLGLVEDVDEGSLAYLRSLVQQ
jgi:hypothetical protein